MTTNLNKHAEICTPLIWAIQLRNYAIGDNQTATIQ